MPQDLLMRTLVSRHSELRTRSLADALAMAPEAAEVALDIPRLDEPARPAEL